jgi:sulfatase maturation enzyme AslB (radical SAM superfamily)
MKVQSFSIDVPGKCPHNCKPCVSIMSSNKKFYIDKLTGNLDSSETFFAYRDRMAYAREKTDTVILTGTRSEPILNKEFLNFFSKVNYSLHNPFYNIEIQTAGYGLDAEMLDYLKLIGVKTISLSLFSLDSYINHKIVQTKYKNFFIFNKCILIKEKGFNLRICLNLNKEGFGDHIFNLNLVLERLLHMKVDQVTFRKLYHNNNIKLPQTKWVIENQLSDENWKTLNQDIELYGKYIRTLDFGAKVYSIKGISTVIDNDCMAKENKNDLKYLIIRRNIRLYTTWDDEGSLLF